MKLFLYFKSLLTITFLALSLFANAQTITPDANGIVYVDINASVVVSTGSGNSWLNATTDLQGAINSGATKVFVAVGTYNVPSPNSFVMKNGVEIYGGFDPVNNITTLLDARKLPSSNGDCSVLNGKNERPIIWNYDNGLTASAILDGFILTGGKATNTTSGGAVYNRNASPTFSNLLFKGNTATNGGAIYNENTTTVLTNVAMVNNAATNRGGAIYNASGTPILTNVTIAGNTASTGSAIYSNDGTPQLNNAIIFGSISGSYTAQYSFIEGSINTANNNLNTTGILLAHVFVNPANGNYAPVAGAPVIDKGNNALYIGLNGNSTDLAGRPRMAGSKIDLGAYEFFGATADVNHIVYVRTNGMGNGTSWTNATGDLHAAINATGAQQIWVEKGTYEVSANSFIMKNGLAIYGGFDPDNNIRTLNDTRILPSVTLSTVEGSILSGRNERPIIWNYASSGSPIDATAILDGFTLAQGAGGGTNSNGGAVYNSYASPKLSNLLITNNKANGGAGVYNENYSAPLLTNCVFSNNQTSNFGSGGAMRNDNSNPKLVNCLMYNNTAYLGGAICNLINAYPNLINCTLVNNHANGSGGAMNSMSYSNPTFLNCIVYGNTATNGNNGIVKDVSLANPLDFFNASLIQGATNFDDNDNIYFAGAITDIFNNPANNDYTLKIGGPAINMGRNIYPNEAGITTDLIGNLRIQGSSVDLGVYEADACAISSIIYVDATVGTNGDGPIWLTPTTGNGASWATAYKTLKDALDIANQCPNVTEIRVAAGTYYPTGTTAFLNQRDKAFTIIRSNLKILGGYNAATGIRDITANPTILSGDIGLATTADNSYQIMILAGIPRTDSLVVDGFTFKNAKADGFDFPEINGEYVFQDSGAGMFIANVGDNVVIRNCIFSNNEATYFGGGLYNSLSEAKIINCTFSNNTSLIGGGVYNDHSGSIIANCTFNNNTAVTDGAGIANDGVVTTISNSTFSNNTAQGNGGGIKNGPYSQITLNNCIFRDNAATADGGGIYNQDAALSLVNVAITNNNANRGGGIYNTPYQNPILTNVTIANNTANTGSAMYIAGGTPQLNNAIIYGSVTGTYVAKYSLVEGKTDVTNGNVNATGITLNGIFTNPTTGDYTLKSTSPIINVGSNALFTGLDMNTKDLAGNQRAYNGYTIDLGAYEYQGDPAVLPVTLLNFTAKADGNRAKLQWQTASETNNKGFEIYRTGDDGKFVKIGNMPAGTDGQLPIATYTFYDNKPLNGTNYYQLVQVDNDGRATERGIRTVNFIPQASDMRLFPNPTSDLLNISFEVGKFSQMEVIDLTGKVLQRIAINVTENSKQVSLGFCLSGTYIIKLSGNGQTESRKIIKK